MIKAVHSFKVLAECRNIVILLFQLHKDFTKGIPTNRLLHNRLMFVFLGTVEALVPVMMKALSNMPVDRGSGFARRDIYADFLCCQVKTLWFLTYCHNRQLIDLMKPYGDRLPQCVLYLLKSTPPNAAAVRKELLMATRHILALELRQGFLPYIEELMKERTLVGEGWTARDVLR